ncbi:MULTISPECIES: anhydro-N-acetylmuramic acid kinase [Cobetia]|uniref:Anhydro-N-acetylmuramic acid kinase n=2 Tax=Cobetia crustatorum TaxID=553385 RepID=A0A558HSL5_9GAMM|nr:MULTISPECIES: anhydro-N-acetylmuramic acid kinase [Cobetia]TVU72109.1 anhydro-N-acetylmuramic acid kinase [Cobetia crustatorum]
MALYLGLMTGTSLDGLDIALLEIESKTAEKERIRFVDGLDLPLPETLRECLWQLMHDDQVRFADLARAEQGLAELAASAIRQLLTRQQLTPNDICAVGSHGQTIEHRPYGFHIPQQATPYTLQLDNPSLLAELCGIAVVGDFRRRDLAAGGQAAPLAPAFHAALFSQPDQWHGLLNLGGIANLTLLPPQNSSESVIGFDTGPANCLLDAWHARHHGTPVDHNGQWAANGRVIPELLEGLLTAEYFAKPLPKSTGREDFHLGWLEQHLSGDETPADVQATLLTLTVESVARSLEETGIPLPAITPCGGGARNLALITALEQRLANGPHPTQITYCAELGWNADLLEAGAFAWLAARRVLGRPGNLPSVTGARGSRVLGGIYAR